MKALRFFPTSIVVALLVVAAVLGMPILMGTSLGMEINCPLMTGEMSMCAGTLAHLTHWQSAFAMILLELLALAMVAFFILRKWGVIAPERAGFVLVRAREPVRPTLLQELFSSGILNPKAF